MNSTVEKSLASSVIYLFVFFDIHPTLRYKQKIKEAKLTGILINTIENLMEQPP